MTLSGGQGKGGAFAGRWNGFVALFVAAWIAPIGYLAPLGFAPLVGLGGLLAAPLLMRQRRLDLWPTVVMGLLLAWMTASILWSPFHPKTLTGSIAFRLFLQVAAGLALISAFAGLSRDAARRGAVLLGVAVVLLSVVLIADALAGARLYMAFKTVIGDPIRPDLARRNIAQAAYVLALLLWPAAQAAARLGWRTAAVPIALIVAGVFAADRLLAAQAPMHALIAGGIVWLAVRWIGPAAGRLLIVASLAAFTVAPLLMLEGVRAGVIGFLHSRVAESWDARLNIWSFVSAVAAEHPLRGWGVDASRRFGAAIPLHPHNAALQVWLELGAPGAALFSALVGWMAANLTVLSRTNPSQAASGAAAMTAYLVIGALSFGVWQEWWVALGLLTVAYLAMLRRAWPDA